MKTITRPWLSYRMAVLFNEYICIIPFDFPVLCPLLDPLINGIIECTGHKIGDTCTLTCDDGYGMTGNVRWRCQKNGRWSDTEAKCTPGWLTASCVI